MALPMNSTPIYNLTVPSTGQEVKFRPFLIKEEKALLLAHQSEDTKVMVDSLKSVIKECIKDPIDINALATFDLEYVFTQIRAKSVGENVELFLKCDTCTDEKAVAKVDIDLTTIEVQRSPDHTNKIALFDDVGLLMKYPTVDLVKRLENIDNANLDQIFNVVVECIDSIYTTNEVFHAKDQTKAELLEFLNNLSSEQFKKVQEFFENMPKLKKDIKYTCPVCSKEHEKTLEGLNSFF
jgi:ribosomal protein L44E